MLGSVTHAVHEHLDKLCIREFPCGDGPWRNDRKWDSDLLDSIIEITDSASLFSVEALKELCSSQPFKKDASWSKEVADLQALSMESPANVHPNLIFSFFKTLRLVGKQVNDVDCGLLKFENLSELTLSANLIEVIKSKFLPRNLKVLELYGNNISDISKLCVDPPLLDHLGLGGNQISSLEDFVTMPDVWSSLLSLDLSDNNLAEMRPTIDTLKLLPKLRNLLMQGNPLRLFLGYRGFVIDSLKTISFLDDGRVSADERHKYKGLSKLKELPLSRYNMEMTMTTLNGIRKPVEAELEPAEPFPRTDIRYHVEFNGIADLCIEDLDGPVDEEGNPLEVADDSSPRDTAAATAMDDNGDMIIIETPGDIDEIFIAEELVVIKSRDVAWAEDGLAINFHKRMTGDTPTAFHRYLKDGIEMRVIESKILVSNEPPEETDLTAAVLNTTGKSGASKAVGKTTAKDKTRASAQKPSAKDEGKAGKAKGKGKEKDTEVFELSREEINIATACIDCAALLEGMSDGFEECLTFKRIEPVLPPPVPSSIQPDAPTHSPSATATPVTQANTLAPEPVDSAKKTGSTVDSALATLATLATRTTSAHPKSAKPGGAKRGGGVKPAKSELEPPAEVNEDDTVPLPITIECTMHLLSWKSAKEGQDWCTADMNSANKLPAPQP